MTTPSEGGVGLSDRPPPLPSTRQMGQQMGLLFTATANSKPGMNGVSKGTGIIYHNTHQDNEIYK